MKLQRAARKYVDIPARFYDRQRREILATSLEVALIAPGASIGPGTVWTAVPLVERLATIYLYGPDAGGAAMGVTAPSFLVPNGGLDLWIRPSDTLESDPVYAERITLF
jgi:hypothetical protein